MQAWRFALIALVPPLIACALIASRARTPHRLLAVELGVALATVALVMASFAFDEPSIIDVALALAVLSVPGTLAFAHYLERWL